MKINNPVAKTVVSTQGDSTSIRALGQVYLNTSGSPRFIAVTISANDGASDVVIAKTDANAAPVLAVAGFSHNSTIAAVSVTLTFIVLAGNYYTVYASSGAPTITSWIEWI